MLAEAFKSVADNVGHILLPRDHHKLETIIVQSVCIALILLNVVGGLYSLVIGANPLLLFGFSTLIVRVPPIVKTIFH